MYFISRRMVLMMLAMFCLALASCSNIPQEVVSLSYQMGEDIAAVQDSYKKLIHQHFDDLRARRKEYLDRIWIPAYVAQWVEDGRLISVASGREVFSEVKDDFVKPSPGREKEELLGTVRMWADAAVGEIDKKRTALLAPLDADEKVLTDTVNEAFATILRGNAAITAHLNSLRKVQGVQDDILKALNLKDLREKLNKGLATASDKAQQALVEVQKADEKVLKLQIDIQNGKTKIKDAAEKLRK